MAAKASFPTNVGKLVIAGSPMSLKKTLETATYVTPGRLLQEGTTVNDRVVNDGVHVPTGWAGYEGQDAESRADSKTATLTAGDEIDEIYGGDIVLDSASMAPGFVAVNGDLLINWSQGRVAPGQIIGGHFCVRVPYEKKASGYLPGVTFVAGMIIGLPQVFSVVADASGTIDIGLCTTTLGDADADGLVDGLALGATGWATHNLVDATNTATNVGDYLMEVQVKDATETPVYFEVQKSPGYVITTVVKLEYTTSNHTQSGYIFIPVSSIGTRIVGKAMEAVATSVSSDQDILVRSYL